MGNNTYGVHHGKLMVFECLLLGYWLLDDKGAVYVSLSSVASKISISIVVLDLCYVTHLREHELVFVLHFCKLIWNIVHHTFDLNSNFLNDFGCTIIKFGIGGFFFQNTTPCNVKGIYMH